MNKEEKVTLVEKIKEDLTTSDLVVLLHYRGLSDKQLYDFRKDLKSSDAKLKIAKNTLIKIAIQDTELNILSDYLNGPTAIAYAKDPVLLAKAVEKASKSNELLEIRAGYLNKEVLPKEAIGNLSKLGSLEEVRASFLGVLSGAQSNFVRLLNATPSGLVSLLNNYSKEKKE
jgi:large subunit ribosomal protein L10